MMRLLKWLFPVLPVFLLSCGSKSVDAGGPLRVVTSVFPVSDIAGRIGGDRIEVFFAVPAGANPHVYEPVPSLVKQISEAGLFLGIHPHFDGWVEKYLNPDARILYLAGEEDVEVNPHIWLDVEGGSRIARMICKALCEADSAHTRAYEGHLNRFLEAQEALDAKIRSRFEGLASRSFIQWHPAWNGLAESYGLHIAGTVEHGHGDTPSPRHLKDLVDSARTRGIHLIVAGLRMENAALQALKQEIDGRILELDTIGGPRAEGRSSYQDLLDWNTRRLAEALQSESGGD